DGYSATWSGGSRHCNAATRSSASRPVAVTASTGRPAPPRAGSAASAPTANGRNGAGAVRSSWLTGPSAAAATAPARVGSASVASSSPASVIASGVLEQHGNPESNATRGQLPAYAVPPLPGSALGPLLGPPAQPASSGAALRCFLAVASRCSTARLRARSPPRASCRLRRR